MLYDVRRGDWSNLSCALSFSRLASVSTFVFFSASSAFSKSRNLNYNQPTKQLNVSVFHHGSSQYCFLDDAYLDNFWVELWLQVSGAFGFDRLFQRFHSIETVLQTSNLTIATSCCRCPLQKFSCLKFGAFAVELFFHQLGFCDLSTNIIRQPPLLSYQQNETFEIEIKTGQNSNIANGYPPGLEFAFEALDFVCRKKVNIIFYKQHFSWIALSLTLEFDEASTPSCFVRLPLRPSPPESSPVRSPIKQQERHCDVTLIALFNSPGVTHMLFQFQLQLSCLLCRSIFDVIQLVTQWFHLWRQIIDFFFRKISTTINHSALRQIVLQDKTNVSSCR